MTRSVSNSDSNERRATNGLILERARAVGLALAIFIHTAYARLTNCCSLDIQYHALRLAYEDKPFMAPITDPAAILDIGTGTGEFTASSNHVVRSSATTLGIWAMDVGQYKFAIRMARSL